MTEINIYPRQDWLQPVMKVYPPILANKFLPEWYKKQVKNKSLYDTTAAAQCPAIKDYLVSGIVIRAWSDIIFNKKTGTLLFNMVLANTTFENIEHTWIDNHTGHQIEGMEFNTALEAGVLKLITPYNFKTSKGYGLEFIDAFYHLRNKLRFLPARVETDIWHEANFVFDFVNPLETYIDGEVLIKAGDPICMAVPYKKDVKSKLIVNDFDYKFYDEHMEKKVLNGSKNHDWNVYKKNAEEE